MNPASQTRTNHNPKPNLDRVPPPSSGRGSFVRETTTTYSSRLWTLPKTKTEKDRPESSEDGDEKFSPYLLSYRKRMLDIGVALAILAVLSPLLVIVALIIRLSSRGPALFRQTRTGASGRTFTIYKFRSMKLQPKVQKAVVQARRDDERVTSFGRFIRRTSIDELPQILNVLNGTMSLVGPRPHAAEHDAYYVTRIPNYSLRFAVLPGLSGLAQINGARGATPRLEDMERRVAYDLAYIQSASLRSDLRILAATIREMLLSSSAY